MTNVPFVASRCCSCKVDVLQKQCLRPVLSIVIPVFNEEQRISSSLGIITDYLRAQPYSYELLLVDDGSVDQTPDICRDFVENHRWAALLRHSKNHGKGCAVRTGVLNAQGEYILVCDADLATPIEELGSFWRFVEEGADIVIASRPLPQSHLVQRQPWYRELAGRAFNIVVRLIAVPGIRDTQCGFKLFRRASAHVVFSQCTLNGFGFDIEVLYLARKLGLHIKEAPIRWCHKEGSKVRVLKDGLSMLLDLGKILIRHRHVRQSEKS